MMYDAYGYSYIDCDCHDTVKDTYGQLWQSMRITLTCDTIDVW